ncbi:hypothetical protein [Azospirillum endophyticum]
MPGTASGPLFHFGPHAEILILADRLPSTGTMPMSKLVRMPVACKIRI